MELFEYDEDAIMKDFEEQCPVFYNLMVSIMTSPETRKQSSKGKIERVVKAKKDAYYVMNHIAKLMGDKALTARAAIVGVFLESQGYTHLYTELLEDF